MPQLIPVQTVIVHRDGKSVSPEIGKPFDFTEAEAKELLELAPKSVREPVNETPAEEVKAPAATKGKAAAQNADL